MSGKLGRRAVRAGVCACLLPFAAAPAAGQTAGASPSLPAPEGPQPAGQPDRVTGRRTYDAAWFAPFAPATALQMVQRVPGFTIERIDESVRGFAQAAGNVVVNGQRPSAKSDDVETILGRIPAGRVVRIEVGTGDQFGAEFATKPQVPTGVETEFRDKHNHVRDPLATLSGSWGFDDGANRTAHLNARLAKGRFALTQDNHVTRPGGFERDDSLTQRRTLDEWEIGGDVTRPLAGGGLKAIGLVTRRTRNGQDRSRFDLSAPTGFDQLYRERLEESLVRVVWNRADLGGWNVEAGAEGVLNRLVSRNDLFSLATGGVRTRIDLPVDDATVKEVRGEGFVNVGRPLSPKLRIDGGLTVEGSRLTVAGDVQAARTLSFLKPRIVLDWRPGPKWHAQLVLHRRAGHRAGQRRQCAIAAAAELGIARDAGTSDPGRRDAAVRGGI